MTATAHRTAPPVPLPVRRSALLSGVAGAVHGYTGRAPGLGGSDGNVGYSAPRDKADAWRNRQSWSAAIGVNASSLVTCGQVHGNTVLRARPGDAGIGAAPRSGKLGLGDALIAAEPGPVLFSLHADCLPILMVAIDGDGRARAVAAVHAGWRGTVADIAGETVRAMTEAFGVRPEDVLASLGPSIGPCCYPVGDEVLAAWAALAGPDAEVAIEHDRHGPRSAFHLAAANALLLERAGLQVDRIELSGACTCCGDGWFSHRGQGPTTGRFAAVVALVAG